MFLIFFLTSFIKSEEEYDQIYEYEEIHKQIYLEKDKINILIKNCFFAIIEASEGQNLNDNWGGCIFYNNQDYEKGHLAIETTTFYNSYGARGGVIFARNVDSHLISVCCLNCHLSKDNGEYFHGSFYSSNEYDVNYNMRSSSVVSNQNENGADTFDLRTTTAAFNACNFSHLNEKAGSILYSERELNLHHCTFSNCIKDEAENPVIEAKNTITITRSTFYELNFAIRTTSTTTIQFSYFQKIQKIEFPNTQSTIIQNCYLDETLISTFNSIKTLYITKMGDNYVPPNFYLYYSGYLNYESSPTEHCPIGPLQGEQFVAEITNINEHIEFNEENGIEYEFIHVYDCIFHDLSSDTNYGEAIFAKTDHSKLLVERTTFDNIIGVYGGVICVENTNVILSKVCSNKGCAKYEINGCSSFFANAYGDDGSTTSNFKQTSVIFSTTIVTESEWGSTISTQQKFQMNACNFSNNQAELSIINFLSYAQFLSDYCSFSYNYHQNPDVIEDKVIFLELSSNAQNINHCTFFKNNIALWSKTSVHISETYFSINIKDIVIEGTPEITLESCSYSDVLKTSGKDGSSPTINNNNPIVLLGSNFPPNYYESMYATEVCPVGTLFTLPARTFLGNYLEFKNKILVKCNFALRI